MTAAPLAQSTDAPTPRRRETGATADRQPTDARYRLSPGLKVIATHAGPGSGPGAGEGGGVLFSMRPLMAMRLDPLGFALLSRLSEGRPAAELTAGVGAPDVSSVHVAAFLDGLADRRLLVKEPAIPHQWPHVSIVVAAYGRPGGTRACVRSLLALDYPSEWLEIIVVDDASDPPLADALAGLPVRLLRREHNIGQSAARNLAAAEAGGDVLAFIDNDCVASRNWLRSLVPYLDDQDVGVVGGRVVAPAPSGGLGAFEAVRSPLDMGAAGGMVGPDQAVAYLPTCNLIVRRDVLLAQGGFTVEMRVGEDVDFVWRALRSGVRACYAPAGEIVHDHRARLGPFLRRRADYGSSEADLQRRHPGGRRVMRLPRTVMLALAALAVFALAWPLSLALTAVAMTMVGLELRAKARRLQHLGVAIPGAAIATAVLREHGASLYHLGASLTRYYGLPMLASVLLWPPLAPVVAVLLLVPPLVDHRRLQPSLSSATFVGFYWLELAAYQVGVWRGCLGGRTLRPLVPKVRWTR